MEVWLGTPRKSSHLLGSNVLVLGGLVNLGQCPNRFRVSRSSRDFGTGQVVVPRFTPPLCVPETVSPSRKKPR